MATPADQRLLDLLNKWLASLELHASYLSLDAEAYLKVQPWPEHERPSRWIIDLARQKTLALREQLEERIKSDDAKFSDSLELMIFLANLIGSQHIERFIPLADPAAQQTPTHEPTVEQPIARRHTSAVAKPSAAPRAVPTHKPEGASKQPVAARSPGVRVAAPSQGRATAKPAAAPERAPSSASRAAGEAAAIYDPDGPSRAAREQVIADAARLVQWGRKWYELAELIASMSDRPHVTDVRRILKDNKESIEKKARRD